MYRHDSGYDAAAIDAFEHVRQGIERGRAAKQETLDLIAALAPDPIELLTVLHTFCHGFDAQAVGNPGDRANDGIRAPGLADVVDELLVDLDLVEREIAQIG